MSKEKVRRLIENSFTREAISLLKEMGEDIQDGSIKNHISMLAARFNTLTEQDIQETESLENQTVSLNKLHADILTLLLDIPEESSKNPVGNQPTSPPLDSAIDKGIRIAILTLFVCSSLIFIVGMGWILIHTMSQNEFQMVNLTPIVIAFTGLSTSGLFHFRRKS
ncbi:MAG: hypothetical protein AAF694_10985 [Bacteroidota bacterium]